MNFGYFDDPTQTSLNISFSPLNNGFVFVYGNNNTQIKDSRSQSYSDFIQLTTSDVISANYGEKASVTWLTVCNNGYYPSNGIFPATACLPCPRLTSSTLLMNHCACVDDYYSLLDSKSVSYYQDVLTVNPVCTICEPGVECSGGTGKLNANTLHLKDSYLLCESGCASGKCISPYTGDFCDQCESGFYLFNRTCKSCENSGLYLGLLFLALIFSPFAFAIITKAWKKFLTISISYFFIQELTLIIFTDILWTSTQSEWRYLGISLFDVSWSNMACFSGQTLVKLFPIIILPIVLACEVFWKLTFYGISIVTKYKTNYTFEKFMAFAQPQGFLILMEILYFPILIGIATIGTCKSLDTPFPVYNCPNFNSALPLFLGFGILIPIIHITARIYLKKKKNKMLKERTNEKRTVQQTVAWPRNAAEVAIGQGIHYKTSAKHPFIMTFQYAKRLAIACFWFGSSSWGPITQVWTIAMVEAFAAMILSISFINIYKGKLGSIGLLLQGIALVITCAFYLTAAIEPPLYKPLINNDRLAYDMTPFLVGALLTALVMPFIEMTYFYFNKSDPELYRKLLKKNQKSASVQVLGIRSSQLNTDLQKVVQVKYDEDGNKKNVVYLTKRALQTMQRGDRDGSESSDDLLKEPEEIAGNVLRGNLIVETKLSEVEKQDTLMRMLKKMENVRDDPILSPDIPEMSQPEESIQMRQMDKDIVRSSLLGDEEDAVEDKKVVHAPVIQPALPTPLTEVRRSRFSEDEINIKEEAKLSDPEDVYESNPRVLTNNHQVKPDILSAFDANVVSSKSSVFSNSSSKDTLAMGPPTIEAPSINDLANRQTFYNQIRMSAFNDDNLVIKEPQTSLQATSGMAIAKSVEKLTQSRQLKEEAMLTKSSNSSLNRSRSNSGKKTSFFSKFTNKRSNSKDDLKMSIKGPTNFKHAAHLDAGSVQLNTLPSEYTDIIQKAGISEEELKDPETFKFIIEFIVKKSAGTVKKSKMKTLNDGGKKLLYIEPDMELEDDQRSTENLNNPVLSITSPTLLRAEEVMPKDVLNKSHNSVAPVIEEVPVVQSRKGSIETELAQPQSVSQSNNSLQQDISDALMSISNGALSQSVSNSQNIPPPPPTSGPPAPPMMTNKVKPATPIINKKSIQPSSSTSDMLASIQGGVKLKSAGERQMPEAVPRNSLMDQIKTTQKLKSVICLLI